MLKPLLLFILLTGCSAPSVPPEYIYKEIGTQNFTLASWQKTGDSTAAYKIYIEGDGHAFNAHGRPSQDPTPHDGLVRKLAFSDPSPNVVYIARPCQYVKSGLCSPRYWTTARFAPEILNAEYEAVKNIAGNRPVILIGFSGGAQIAGLLAAAKPDLNIKKVITVAGNLDHRTWTQYHNLPPLNESLNLADEHVRFTQIPQMHYAGTDDDVIPPLLIKNFIGNTAPVMEISGATHSSGWENIFPLIHNEK